MIYFIGFVLIILLLLTVVFIFGRKREEGSKLLGRETWILVGKLWLYVLVVGAVGIAVRMILYLIK